MLRLQRVIGNRRVGRLLDVRAGEGRRALRVGGIARYLAQRYGVEGPWNKGDPVHEVLTLTAIRDALRQVASQEGGAKGILKGVDPSKFPNPTSTKGHNIAPEKIDKSAQQFIRGVVWPDDPKGYLFDEASGTGNYSSGAMWLEEFDADEKEEPEELTARSHYGDLQFFHAMATRDEEDPKETKKKMLEWSRFLADVSTGRIDVSAKLKDIPLTNRLFPSHGDYTVAKVFGYEKGKAKDIQQRAAGALMHMVQDSNAAGHTERGAEGDLQQFRSYEQQDSHKHGKHDAWAAGKTLADRIKNTPGAENAIRQCTDLLVKIDQGASTDEIVELLDRKIFKLSEKAKKSAPGEAYKK